MTDILIRIGDEALHATLTDEHSPRTVAKILAALPITSTTQTWGDEIYFTIPVDAPEENGREVVHKGDLGFWPVGSCFCIFYGRTPMSASEDEIVPASAVNLIGTVEHPDEFRKHRSDEPVTIELAE